MDDRRNEYTRQWRARRKALSGPTVTGPTSLVAAIGSRPAWYSRAACRGLDPALFYPTRGEINSGKRNWPAFAVCASCPVRADCLEEGLYEAHGIWGGTTERERVRMRGRGRKPAA